MGKSPRLGRYLLSACAALAVVVAVILAFAVIPQVRVTTAPDISPDRAIPAFWVSAGLQILAASMLMLTAVLSRGRSRSSTAVLVATGIAMLLLGFALSDAAVAFFAAGQSLRFTGALLVMCTLADVGGGMLAIVTALLRPRVG